MRPIKNPRSLAAIIGATAAAVVLVLTPNWEGTELKTYKDVAGVLTYCTGAIENAQWGRTYTPIECRAQLDRDLARHAEGMMACVTRPMTDGQRIAYTDFTFNLGVGAFCSSSMMRLTNAGDPVGGCNALTGWDKITEWKPVKQPDGTVKLMPFKRAIRGLTLRREAERKICLKGLK